MPNRCKTGYFDSDIYHTPEKEHLSSQGKNPAEQPACILHGNMLRIVLVTRKQAVRKLYDTKAWTDSSFYIFRFIEKCGGKFHITGMENITKSEGPVLFISNHMSTLETMIFPCIIAPLREVTFVVKESLVKTSAFW